MNHIDSNIFAHYDVNVRTTVTIDADVAIQLKEIAHQRRTSFKSVLNETLRRGLSAQQSSDSRPPFKVVPHAGGFQPGIDVGKLNQLLDNLDAEDFTNEVARDS